MVFIRQKFERLEGLYSDNDNVERATGTEGNLCSMVPNGRAGRPDFNEKVNATTSHHCPKRGSDSEW